MIDPKQLLADLQKLLRRLEPDIRGRCQSNPEIDVQLRGEYDKAKAADRTAQAFEVWRDDYITQVAVAWILGCVFVRFLEDNHLISTAWLAGPGATRLQLARDQHTVYFQANPSHSDREYLEHVFREIAKLPSMHELLAGKHNPILKLGPTGDGAHELLEFWQRVDPSTGAIVHNFTDPEWNTRFLGDLYQDLSESARERFALLQTPEFVEEFILDRTLSPAIDEFGYATVRMIDPACGSGHFLLGGFRRLLALRLRHEPGVAIRAQVEASLGQVSGVDINPFAAAIARFRLLIAALKACATHQLSNAPGFQINIAVGDSLLHGPSPKGFVGVQRSLSDDPLQHYYDIEDADRVRELLSQQYQVVVGNPPYITVKDRALNHAYRTRFRSCHMKYSLSSPFVERMLDLTQRQSDPGVPTAGFVGIFTANSFMRREFGKKLVEEILPRVDLTHVVDTSRAHIPDHGTPTVILFARNRQPISATVRAVMGIRAEAQRPIIAAEGRVWQAIVSQVDRPGSESAYITVTDLSRASLTRHPWSLGGGGAAELRLELEERASGKLGEVADSIGFMTIPGDDDIFIAESRDIWARLGICDDDLRQLIPGESIRDWSYAGSLSCIFPYDKAGRFVGAQSAEQHFWKYRIILKRAPYFGKTKEERGLDWRDYAIVIKSKFRNSYSIAYSNVATHNHFVLSRGEVIFNSHSPVIKLPVECSVDDHLQLLGLLNSSTGCFWMKQVFHNKGGGGIGGGLATEEWEQFYELDGTKLAGFPLLPSGVSDYARELDRLANENWSRRLVAEKEGSEGRILNAVDELRAIYASRSKLRSMQEELDWFCYRQYGIIQDDLNLPVTSVPDLELGQRAFEILLARRVRDGESETTWFDRHKAMPIVDLPDRWPEEYRTLVQRRLIAIDGNPALALVEQPTFKRRWNFETFDEEVHQCLRVWLLERLERLAVWSNFQLRTCSSVADYVGSDPEFTDAASRYRGRPDFDMTALVTELVHAETVPLLSVLRYKDTGIRKRAVWERTWELQRREDAIDTEVAADSEIQDSLKAQAKTKRKFEEVGDIPAPPKYDTKDFQKAAYWSLRGKLDLPKERFISFPFCERDVDQSAVIGWAGWSHLQQAQAIAAYYERVKTQEGWTSERRVPLLTGIVELLPWLKQWQNDIHPEYQERMGDFFEQFVEDEARAMEMTLDEIRHWTPPAQSNARGRKKKNT